MAQLKFIDVNVTLGRPAMPKYHVAEDAGVMAKELGDFGIAGGLVRHAYAMEGSPAAGNDMLAKALAKAPHFSPMWTVIPHWTGEFSAPERLIEDMAAAGARAAVMYPTTQGYPMRPSIAGPILDVLEEARVPLFIPYSETQFRVVEKVMRRHPSLPVVIAEVPQGIAREAYPLFKLFPKLSIEISVFMLHLGIEDVCRRFGPERLIFGTRYPLYNPGCAIAAVTYARIGDQAKQMIASGNIERLLKEVRFL